MSNRENLNLQPRQHLVRIIVEFEERVLRGKNEFPKNDDHARYYEERRLSFVEQSSRPRGELRAGRKQSISIVNASLVISPANVFFCATNYPHWCCLVCPSLRVFDGSKT